MWHFDALRRWWHFVIFAATETNAETLGNGPRFQTLLD
jgi:hypothetical protein